MTQPTQAQIAHVIFNRIANGEDVPEKQRNELLKFLGLTAEALNLEGRRISEHIPAPTCSLDITAKQDQRVILAAGADEAVAAEHFDAAIG